MSPRGKSRAPVVSNGDSRPVPDPTELTSRALNRIEKTVRDYIDAQVSIRDERLRGIDAATQLRLDTIKHIPDRIDEKVATLSALTDERVRSIGVQFVERDTRAEREARDNKVAVDAAFAAQKEAAAKQDEGNQKAIDKSEIATAEKIEKLAELFRTTVEGLSDKIEDVKDRVGRIESVKAGAIENRTGLYATLGIIASLLLVGVAILGVIVGRIH